MTDDAAVVDGGATAAMVNTRQGLLLGDRSLATSGGTNAAIDPFPTGAGGRFFNLLFCPS